MPKIAQTLVLPGELRFVLDSGERTRFCVDQPEEVFAKWRKRLGLSSSAPRYEVLFRMVPGLDLPDWRK